jgi:UDP-glucose 4-epimerase
MSETPTGRLALVTGGAGFIGGHLVDGLLTAGWRVRALDDLSTGNEANLADSIDRIEFCRGDIRDEAVVSSMMRGVDVVFHQAAVPSVPKSVEQPLLTNSVNVEGTLRVLEAARQAGVRRVVFAASSSAYGESEVLPKVETHTANPCSPYALQKYCGEVYCRLYHELFGLETVALRYFNIFGPRQDPQSHYAAVIPSFVSAAIERRCPVIYGDGEQTRDFTYIENVVEANLRAADAERVRATCATASRTCHWPEISWDTNPKSIYKRGCAELLRASPRSASDERLHHWNRLRRSRNGCLLCRVRRSSGLRGP